MEELGENRKLFPLHEIGVAQGSCLSPLIGNIVLAEFDEALNTNDISCIRYIDDFIILASCEKDLNGCFRKAQRILGKLGMEAYEPQSDSGKCELGPTTNNFAFLGCDIRRGMIRPGRNSYQRLIASIEQQIEVSKGLMSTPDRLIKRKATFIETLGSCSNIIRGWGSQYSFCNDYQLTESLDIKIDNIIREYISYYSNAARELETQDSGNRRRLLGVSLLSDCKNDPIIKSQNNI